METMRQKHARPTYIGIITIFLLLYVLVSTVTKQEQIMVDEPYVFPIRPGSAEWLSFTSRSEMVDACQIPEDILPRLTTEALLETILTYPMIDEMRMLFADEELKSMEYGFWHIANSFNGLEEFMNREDALTVLEHYGGVANPASNGNVLAIMYRNIAKLNERDEFAVNSNL